MYRSGRDRLLLALILIVGLVLVYDSATRWGRDSSGRGVVAILDPLSEDSASDFTAKCAELFEGAGYEVEAFLGEEVTLNRIKGLSSEYAAIIFRVHSGVFEGKAWFFTGEPYDNSKHVMEQLANQVHIGRTARNSDLLFAVGADFVTTFLEDRLGGTLIVLMGCDGLASRDLADAFLGVGASAFVSWDGPVLLADTDNVTLALVEGLVSEMTLSQALERSLQIAGGTHGYNSSLTFIPEERYNFTLRKR